MIKPGHETDMKLLGPKLPPGSRDMANLDALVALALGWIKVGRSWYPPGTVGSLDTLPPFSTDAGEAIKALEEFFEERRKNANFPPLKLWFVRWSIRRTKENQYYCILETIGSSHGGFPCETIPHAICLAIIEAGKEKR